MAIFAVLDMSEPGRSKLAEVMPVQYPENFYKLSGDTWLVADRATVQEVSQKLGITDGTSGAALIIQISSYFGRATPTIWDWIKVKWEATSG